MAARGWPAQVSWVSWMRLPQVSSIWAMGEGLLGSVSHGACLARHVGDESQRENVTGWNASGWRRSSRATFERLLSLLDPEVVLRADDTAARMGIPRPQEMRGPHAVAGLFSGAAQTLETALIDGTPGLVWAVRGVPRVVFTFEFRDGRVTRIDQIADREAMARLRVELDV